MEGQPFREEEVLTEGVWGLGRLDGCVLHMQACSTMHERLDKLTDDERAVGYEPWT